MALYHTHRPQTFDDLIDQEHIVTTLKNQLINKKTAHAYLFSGPRGVGKTTTARILAKSLNCTGRKDDSPEPCNNCTSCAEITAGRSIDVIEIDAASHTGVDNVRQNIIDSTQFKPTMSKFKIFIIDEVHMLSTAAFNALLKTLEEPPKYIVFILATTDPQKLPATIISRCQRFGFRKVSDSEMTKHIENIAKIEKVKIDDEVVRRIVKKSEGCARDAVSLLDQLMASGDKNITTDTASLILPSTNIERQIDFVESLLAKNQRDAVTQIATLTAEGVSLPHFARDLVEFMRVLMIASVDIDLAQKEMDLHTDAQKKLASFASQTTQHDILRLVDITLRRIGEIKTSPLPQLPLEMLIIEWCAGVQDMKPIATQQVEPQQIQTTPMEKKVEKVEVAQRTVKHIIDAHVDVLEKKEDKPKPVPEKVTPPLNTTPIDQKTFESKWPLCIKEVETQAPSLVFILKMAQFLGIENNVAKFSVEFGFHKDKLMEKITKEKIESIIGSVVGTQVYIDIVTDPSKNTETASNQELQNLASALGGQVI